MPSSFDILKLYGPPPYYVIYATGMALPCGQEVPGVPYDPEADPHAEMFAGPFDSWDQMIAASRTPLTDPIWKWGNAPIFGSPADLKPIIDAHGPPRVTPEFF